MGFASYLANHGTLNMLSRQVYCFRSLWGGTVVVITGKFECENRHKQNSAVSNNFLKRVNKILCLLVLVFLITMFLNQGSVLPNECIMTHLNMKQHMSTKRYFVLNQNLRLIRRFRCAVCATFTGSFCLITTSGWCKNHMTLLMIGSKLSLLCRSDNLSLRSF